MAAPSIRGQIGAERKPADPDPKVLEEVSYDFDKKINSNPTAAGLAIVVGNTTPAGVELDLKRMAEAFMQLNFVVIKQFNPASELLVALLHTAAGYKYPQGYFRFIAFYFAGHGGSHDTHSFIYPSSSNQCSKLFVEEGILKHFYPENSQVLGNRVRLFFFDNCLKDDTLKGPSEEGAQFDESGGIILPARGNILVAYATSMTFASRGSRLKGGYWTRHLHENLVNLDMSLTTVLDITWEETVMDTHKSYKGDLGKIQGPHYISCLGLVYLKHPSWSGETALKHTKAATNATTSDDLEGGECARWYEEPATTSKDPSPAASETMPDGEQYPLVQPGSKAALLLCKKPEGDDVLAMLARFSCKWESIGKSLAVDSLVLSKMETCRQQPRDSLNSIIQSWVSSPEATWGVLIQALHDTLPSAAQRVVECLERDI